MINICLMLVTGQEINLLGYHTRRVTWSLGESSDHMLSFLDKPTSRCLFIDEFRLAENLLLLVLSYVI